jgi:ornithine carbamoyltransferase
LSIERVHDKIQILREGIGVEMKRDLISISDLKREEIIKLLKDTKKIKDRWYSNLPWFPLTGKTMLLIFEKPSTRTRVSFEAGFSQLGGRSIFITPQESQLSKGETIEDTARTVSRYVDIVVLRVFEHEKVVRFAQNSKIPVINGLSDLLHPCQILADLFTIWEKLGRFEDFKLVFVGDGSNNVANSLVELAGIMNFELVITCPPGYEPEKDILNEALKKGGNIKINYDPFEAVKGADVIYTDVWCSMGQELEYEKRLQIFKDFQVNSKLMGLAKRETLFMHCLPAKRGLEVTDEVIDGPNSIVFDEAENRLHVQKAIVLFLLGINP